MLEVVFYKAYSWLRPYSCPWRVLVYPDECTEEDINACLRGCTALGLDTEWTPDTMRCLDHPIALLQLATDDAFNGPAVILVRTPPQVRQGMRPLKWRDQRTSDAGASQIGLEALPSAVLKELRCEHVVKVQAGTLHPNSNDVRKFQTTFGLPLLNLHLFVPLGAPGGLAERKGCTGRGLATLAMEVFGRKPEKDIMYSLICSSFC